MRFVQTTLDNVAVGGTFYGRVSKERYTKVGCSRVRAEEGSGKGDIWNWITDVTVLVEAPKTPPSKRLVRTTFDNVPVGGTFYGPAREERYTKISSISSRKEEGFCKGYIFNWRRDNIFLVEAPQAHLPQQDEMSDNSADDNKRKLWHRCCLCEHGPDGGCEDACDDCDGGYSEWKPDKAMLAWHEDMMIKGKPR
jgi:hypothetical protein